MACVINKVQNELKKKNNSHSQFYRDYQKTAKMYQELIDKGLTSKRESRLPSVTERMAIIAKTFRHSSEREIILKLA